MYVICGNAPSNFLRGLGSAIGQHGGLRGLRSLLLMLAVIDRSSSTYVRACTGMSTSTLKRSLVHARALGVVVQWDSQARVYRVHDEGIFNLQRLRIFVQTGAESIGGNERSGRADEWPEKSPGASVG